MWVLVSNLGCGCPSQTLLHNPTHSACSWSFLVLKRARHHRQLVLRRARWETRMLLRRVHFLVLRRVRQFCVGQLRDVLRLRDASAILLSRGLFTVLLLRGPCVVSLLRPPCAILLLRGPCAILRLLELRGAARFVLRC